MQEYTDKEYKIRKMCREDNADIAMLIRGNLKKHGLDIPGTAYYDPHIDDFYSFYADRVNGGYFVLTDQAGKVVGGIGFDTIDEQTQTAELQKMYLDDSVKGQGLGYFLIGFIEARMKEADIRTSYLETHSNLQAAIHIYEKVGYKRTEQPAVVGHSTMDHFYSKTL